MVGGNVGSVGKAVVGDMVGMVGAFVGDIDGANVIPSHIA